MTFKIDHIRGGTTFRAPVQIGGPTGPAAPAKPAARELPPACSALLRRLGLDAPAAGKKLALREVDAAMIKANMLTAARLRAKSELAFYGVIAA